MHSRYSTYRLVPAPSKPKRSIARAVLAALLLAPTLVAATPLAALSQEPPPVIIEEVAWAGSSLSSADEWIELANLANATTTVGGWAIHGAGSSDRVIFLPEDAEIPPLGTYLVANYAEDHEKSSLLGPVALATSTLSLSNSALALELRNADGIAVDRAGDGSGPFAGSSANLASMLRVVATNGDYAESWVSATSSVGFKPDVADLGTPGVCDLCITPEEPADETAEETIAEEPDEPDETATSTVPTIEDGVTTSTNDVPDVLTTTSTEDIPEIAPDESDLTFDSPSSTEPEGPNEVVATSTESEVPDEIIEEEAPEDDPDETTETSTETVVVTPSSQGQTTTATTNSSSSVTTASSASNGSTRPPVVFRLNEAVSNPVSGPEWVEIYVQDNAVTSTDRELELHDASGKIATITKGTPLIAPNYLVIVLSSAKLNNGGDEVSLRETNGIVIDQTEIPQTYKGESWAKDPSDNAWKIAESLTPGAQNLFPTIEIESAQTSSETTAEEQTTEAAQTSTSSVTESSATSESTSQSSETETSDTLQTTTDYSDQIGEVFAAAMASNSQTDQKTGKSTSKSSSSSSPDDLTPYPFDDMFHPELNEARVRVTGTVASVSRLLGASHVFILQNEDGRGIIVYPPKHLNIPAFGSTIQIGGTLSATYKGPELRMKKTDVWVTLATSTPPTPRLVDLLAPSAEDAWSLVSVEGTVREVKATSFVLETDDGIEIPVSVPAAVGYKAGRLAKEDRVRVTGLLDTRKDAPSLLPRTAEEIELVKHAEDTIAATGGAPERHFPDWVPFAAAGGAITLTGAAKRARELIRKRKLQLLMKKAEATA